MIIINSAIDRKITKLQVEVLVKYDVTSNKIKNFRYERKIRKSQAKLAETTLVPGYTKIYA